MSPKRSRPIWPLVLLGAASLPVYALAQGPFRPRPYSIEPFLICFGIAFLLYVGAVRLVVRTDFASRRRVMIAVWGFALAFNGLLLPSPPTLSDDMYRYVWDGRVQGNGINPYRYASNAYALYDLRDDAIWARMNRIDAHTIYPPGAQIVFALAWRVFGDSVIGFKAVMIGAVMLAGWLLVMALKTLDLPPERALIFLWNPLLIFETAHAAHVDALFLPLVVAAFLIRLRAPQDRPRRREEALIGILLGGAVLIKLIPVVLAPAMWSVRDRSGHRRLRLALPITLVLTVGAGYALYLAPGVNVLGFLGRYAREFFNVGPLPEVIVELGYRFDLPYYRPVSAAMFGLFGLIALLCLIFPARSAQGAVMRCAAPIAAYLLVNLNLFSWYALWLLPLVALGLTWRGRLPRFNFSLAWLVFSGTLALSYVFFLDWTVRDWAIAAQFWPVYFLLGAAAVEYALRHRRRSNRKGAIP